MDTKKLQEEVELSEELDKDHLPMIISKVEAVSQALFLAYSDDEEGDDAQFFRRLHWILDDAVGEFRVIGNQLCGA
jgi:hypothetical protein